MKEITKAYIRNCLPIRKSYQNKGDFGHVLVIGGSIGMAGSVCMAALGALKSGAGLVTVAVPKSVSDIVAVKLTECMVLPVNDFNGEFDISASADIVEFCKKCNTIVFGMGARKSAGTVRILESLLLNYTGALVLDADGLNVLSENPDFLNIKRRCSLILTPHPGEMSRLVSQSVSDVQSNRGELASSYAEQHDLTIVLKGERTVVANKDILCVNPTGNVGMATGGSGDVLAGIIGAFAAQGLSSADSACCGCFIHGLSGDIAVKEKTYFCLTACDLIDFLPKAFGEILN